MSVLLRNRGDSRMEFVNTARELYVLTMKRCANFPKRYMFFITTKIVDSADKVYTCVSAANSISRPLNEHEWQMRRDYFITANAELDNIIIRLNETPFPIAAKHMEEWMSMIDKEKRLIAGVQKKDLQNLAKLQKDND